MFHSETFAAQVCGQLFANDTSVVNSKTGAQFLHDRDSRLHTTNHVEKKSSQHKRAVGITLIKPADKIDQWLISLERIAKKAETSPRAEKILKNALYKQYVIKAEDVPESYYAHQIRIARERGHGDIILAKQQKMQMAETLIVDQKKSLDKWQEYLISKDTAMYPMWFKYWAYTGMTKLSKYDPLTGTFGHRTKETVAPFPELNREALAYIADVVLKKVQKKSLEEIDNPEFVHLLKDMNFGKLYAKILFQSGVGKEGQFKTNEGRWVVYPQGSDHMPLVKSLEGRHTGWCTAGESTAQSQLSRGDFHVFYSFDDKRQATIPRVAIRMDGAEIAEVRGVGKEQNTDAQINESTVVADKMKEFGAKAKSFEKKDRDMKYLSELERKNTLGEKLSKDDFIFLYELNAEIEGFGYGKDPRIDQIKSTRDFKDDVLASYDNRYSRDEISNNPKEALNGKIKIYFGSLSFYPDSARDTVPRIMKGLLFYNSMRGVVLPETIHGSLSISDLASESGLVLPKTINGKLFLSGRLTSTKGLKRPNGLTHYEGPAFED